MRAKRRHATRIVTVYFEQREVRQRAWASGRVPMPEIFCLSENYEESAQALIATRDMLQRGVLQWLRKPQLRRLRPRRITNYMDFATIKRCSPAAALVLASEFHRARLLVETWNIPVIDIDHWRRTVVGTLDDIGFFDLLEIRHPQARVPNARITKFSSGEVASGVEAKALFDKLAEIMRVRFSRKPLEAWSVNAGTLRSSFVNI
jgi:hypothetical protein